MKTLLQFAENADLRRYLPVVTAMGNGSVDSKLERLMVWVAAKIHLSALHSQINDPWQILALGEGFCDQLVLVFCYFAATLLDEVKYCRRLGIVHQDGLHGHNVAEIFYNDGWHLFDPSPFYVACYRRDHVLSYDEICEVPQVIEDHWWGIVLTEKINGSRKGFFPGKSINVHEYNFSSIK